MTFKHLKFAESSTMQAFEKLAKSKGLVKPEEAPKKAEAKVLDLNPSGNLLDNILKLASGLRSQGFHKHADDLETKYLQFKQADSLYETSKETGDDLIDQAHPKGSHKLEGVEGDAVVETISDAKKKIEEIVNKKPTGKLAAKKLATANEILNAVKLVVAQDAEDDARQLFIATINEAVTVVNQILRNEDLSDWTWRDNILEEGATTGMALKSTKGHFEVLIENLNEIAKKGPSMESVKELKANLTTLMNLSQRASNISPTMKSKYSGMARDIYSRADKILAVLRGEKPAAPAQVHSIPEVTVVGDPLLGKIDDYIGKLSAYEGVVNSARDFTPAERKQALEWIKSQKGDFQKIKSAMNGIQDENARKAVAGRFERNVNELAKEVDEFYTNWIA